MRRLGAILVVGAALLSAAPAAAAPVAVSHACLYTFDNYWRTVPLEVEGALVRAADGTPAAGARLDPGEAVRLEAARVNAQLPDWLAREAYNAGLLQPGLNQIPLVGQIALEGTNTVERIQRVSFTGVARSTVTTTPDGTLVSATPFDADDVALADTTWTPAGGRVAIRAGTGDLLGSAATFRGERNVFGSTYIEASVGPIKFVLECLPGFSDVSDAGHRLFDATPFATAAQPALTATRDGAGPLPGLVDAGVAIDGVHPPRGVTGDGRTVTGAVLHVALTPDQLAELVGGLGDGTHALTVGGEVELVGANVTPAGQTAALTATAWPVTIAGATVTAAPLALPLAPTTWTLLAADPATVGAGAIELTVSGVVALTLTRAGRDDPFLTLARARPQTIAPTPTPTPTAQPTPAPVSTPTPSPTPQVSPPRPAVSIGTLSWRSRPARLRLALRNTGRAQARGSISVRTVDRIRRGSRRTYVTVATATRYTLRAGGRTTVRLRLTRAGRALLAERPRVRLRAAVTVSGARAVVRRLQARRG